MLRSIRSNAEVVVPRLGLVVVLLWLLWFGHSVVQNTWMALRRQVSCSAGNTVCKLVLF